MHCSKTASWLPSQDLDQGRAADTYSTDADSGDHDLDAFMLSMLGIELNYGLWHTKETVRRLVQIAHVSGWGLPSTVISQQAHHLSRRQGRQPGCHREDA